jgi:hypothetical protein
LIDFLSRISKDLSSEMPSWILDAAVKNSGEDPSTYMEVMIGSDI